ncbi:MAG: hypothetical protein IJ509_03200 [Bacilli bacterium]|nr:hypothetical protein [Bacilli bacterium]
MFGKEIKESLNGNDIEEVTARIIKFMLEENVSMDIIKDITEKSVEEIKEIGELSD